MISVKSMDVRDHFKDFCDKAFNGEVLIVSRPKNENVVIISESKFNEMERFRHNEEYLAMLDKSFADAESGKVISKTIEELEAFE